MPPLPVSPGKYAKYGRLYRPIQPRRFPVQWYGGRSWRVRPRNDPHFIKRNRRDFSTHFCPYFLSRSVLCIVMHYLHWIEAKRHIALSERPYSLGPLLWPIPFFFFKKNATRRHRVTSLNATPRYRVTQLSRSASDNSFLTLPRGTERHYSLGPRPIILVSSKSRCVTE